MVDIAPTLLSAAGVAVPESMQGNSAMPLVEGRAEGWRNEVFIQMAEWVNGRALRTSQYTYAVASTKRGAEIVTPISERFMEYQTRNLTGGHVPAPYSDRYAEYQFYDLTMDPYQLVNLAGRDNTLAIEAELRERLTARIREVDDHPAEIDPPVFAYP